MIYRELPGVTGRSRPCFSYREQPECRFTGSLPGVPGATQTTGSVGFYAARSQHCMNLKWPGLLGWSRAIFAAPPSLLKSCDTRQAVSSLDAWLLSKLCVTDFWCHRAPGPQGYGARLRHGTREDLVSCQSAAVAAAKLCVSQRSTSSYQLLSVVLEGSGRRASAAAAAS